MHAGTKNGIDVTGMAKLFGVVCNFGEEIRL